MGAKTSDFKFQLTKHREMWTWLAENLEVDEELSPEECLAENKKKWLNKERVYNYCFACDYGLKKDPFNPCNKCPLLYDCRKGIYRDLLLAIKENNEQEIYSLCMLFVNSPVKPWVEVE